MRARCVVDIASVGLPDDAWLESGARALAPPLFVVAAGAVDDRALAVVHPAVMQSSSSPADRRKQQSILHPASAIEPQHSTGANPGILDAMDVDVDGGGSSGFTSVA